MTLRGLVSGPTLLSQSPGGRLTFHCESPGTHFSPGSSEDTSASSNAPAGQQQNKNSIIPGKGNNRKRSHTVRSCLQRLSREGRPTQTEQIRDFWGRSGIDCKRALLHGVISRVTQDQRTAHLEHVPPRGPRTPRRAAGSSRRGQAVPETRAAGGRGRRAGPRARPAPGLHSHRGDDLRLHAFVSNKHTGSKTQHKKLWTLLNIQPQAQVSFLKRPSGRRLPSEALFTRAPLQEAVLWGHYRKPLR